MSTLRNFMFVGKANQFNGSSDNPAEADKNGYMPVIIVPSSGQCPSARVLSGSIAANLGLLTDHDADNELARAKAKPLVKSFLMTAQEVAPSDDDVAQGFTANKWIFEVVQEVSVADIMMCRNDLGAAAIIEVPTNGKNSTVATEATTNGDQPAV